MAKSGFKRGVVNRFVRDLVDTTDIAEAFVEGADIVTRRVISEAMDGVGPDGIRFIPYSAEYKKRKDKASGQSRAWLRGLNKPGRHMLERDNFRWFTLKGGVQLVWTAKGNQGDYAEVHNEGEGKMPKREWMHLEAPKTAAAIDTLLGVAFDEKIDKFNRKYRL